MKAALLAVPVAFVVTMLVALISIHVFPMKAHASAPVRSRTERPIEVRCQHEWIPVTTTVPDILDTTDDNAIMEHQLEAAQGRVVAAICTRCLDGGDADVLPRPKLEIAPPPPSEGWRLDPGTFVGVHESSAAHRHVGDGPLPHGPECAWCRAKGSERASAPRHPLSWDAWVGWRE